MDAMFCMNGTTSALKSVLRYVVDKVKLCSLLLKHEILKKLVTFITDVTEEGEGGIQLFAAKYKVSSKTVILM